MIGDNIRITVLDLKGARVRLGIEAPREVSVNRGEVQERIANDRPIQRHDAECGIM